MCALVEKKKDFIHYASESNLYIRDECERSGVTSSSPKGAIYLNEEAVLKRVERRVFAKARRRKEYKEYISLRRGRRRENTNYYK